MQLHTSPVDKAGVAESQTKTMKRVLIALCCVVVVLCCVVIVNAIDVFQTMVHPKERSVHPAETSQSLSNPTESAESLSNSTESDESMPRPLQVVSGQTSVPPTKSDQSTSTPTESDQSTSTPTESEQTTPTPVESDQTTPTESDESTSTPTEGAESHSDGKRPDHANSNRKPPNHANSDGKRPNNAKSDGKRPNYDQTTQTPTESDQTTPTESDKSTSTPTEAPESVPQPTESDQSTSNPMKRDDESMTRCGIGWKLIDERCFTVVPCTRRCSASQGPAICHGKGGHMGLVDSSSVNKQIVALVRAVAVRSTTAGHVRLFIDGSDTGFKRRWVSSQGTYINYLHWAHDQPNLERWHENCLSIWIDDTHGDMYDVWCGNMRNKANYLCEKFPEVPATTPEATTPEPPCPDDQISVNDRCYAVVTCLSDEPCTGKNDRERCTAQGLEPTVIDSADVNTALVAEAERKGVAFLYLGMWKKNTGAWVTTMGQKEVTFFNWATDDGQPTTRTYDRCAGVFVTYATKFKGHWNDVSCTFDYRKKKGIEPGYACVQPLSANNDD